MTVHHQQEHRTIVADDRDGPAMALITVLAIMLVAFLVWFFAFSGVVFNHHSSSTTGGTSNPPAVQNQTNTNTSGGSPTNPSPAPS